MARGRRRDQWDHTAAVMSWVGRLVDAPFEPERLNPYRRGDDAAGGGRRAAMDPGREAAMGWAALAAGLRHVKG